MWKREAGRTAAALYIALKADEKCSLCNKYNRERLTLRAHVWLSIVPWGTGREAGGCCLCSSAKRRREDFRWWFFFFKHLECRSPIPQSFFGAQMIYSSILYQLSHKGSPRILEWVAYPSEKAVAPHSSTLAWKIPWTTEPGRLQSMELLRVGHDWVTSLSLFTFMLWRRKWQPAPVFLPGESQGWRSLMGCRLWGRAESDTTEAT